MRQGGNVGDSSNSDLKRLRLECGGYTPARRPRKAGCSRI